MCIRDRKVIIVTQRYHLYRALYAAKQLGLDAYGVASDQRTYAGQKRRDVRAVSYTHLYNVSSVVFLQTG